MRDFLKINYTVNLFLLFFPQLHHRLTLLPQLKQTWQKRKTWCVVTVHLLLHQCARISNIKITEKINFIIAM